MKISPLAPTITATLPSLAGVTLATAESNIRYKDRPDLLLMHFAKGTQAAGVFTRSLTVAAPVEWCKTVIAAGEPRALLVNAGNANACTGDEGVASLGRIVQFASALLKCDDNRILMASTGVIGEPLPDAKITARLPELHKALGNEGWDKAAQAIMTTDTFPKLATRKVKIDGVEVTIHGIAKGSGMIAPNMATLLAFVFTDATLSQSILTHLLQEANEDSFNAITVDGDASTNDTLLAFATCAQTHSAIASLGDPKFQTFRQAFHELLLDLAIQVVKDGEGAQKFFMLTVKGAKSKASARAIGLTVANSPLVKTAIAGEDANWGRIFAAAGRSGEFIDPGALSLTIGGHLIAKDGMRIADYNEAPVTQHMKGNHLDIVLDVGAGSAKDKVYSCDLTHGYIDINGSYRS